MSTSDVDYLRLTAENFGPIERADVELRPLTVFVGPSASGKSYMAKLIYALHDNFGRRRGFRRRRWKRIDFYDRVKAPVDLELVADWLEEYLADDGTEGEIEPPADVENLAREAIKLPDLGKVFAGPLQYCFGTVALGDLIRHSQFAATLTLQYSPPDTPKDPPPFRYSFLLRHDSLTAKVSVREDAPIRLDRSRYPRRPIPGGAPFGPRLEAASDASRTDRRRLKTVLADLAEGSAVGSLSRPAHYLPAGRSGGSELQQVIVGSALDRLTAAGHRASSTPSLSGVLSEYFAATSLDVLSRSKRWSRGDALASLIEQTVLGGTVRVEESDDGVPHVLFRPEGWEEDLPLARASSMVTEIVPLALYLRYHLRANETVIIEEPEAHMHPAMQVRFAAALAKIVAAGIRVIITVHSDWILSALANICRMAELPEEERTDMAGGDVTLPSNQVGVWEFVPNGSGGTETREIKLDSENGMYDAGYPRVAQALYDDWATIHDRLQER